MVIKPWKIIEEKDISPSKWFPLFKYKLKLPNGKIVEDFYASKLGNIAMILPITKNKEIIFIKEYKPGINEVILQLPAGRTGSLSIEETARKELEEETGIISKTLIPLGRVSSMPTKDSAINYGFLAKDVEIKSKLKLDDTEDIELVPIPIKKLNSYIKSEKIISSDSLAFLLIAKVKYPELFA